MQKLSVLFVSAATLAMGGCQGLIGNPGEPDPGSGMPGNTNTGGGGSGNPINPGMSKPADPNAAGLMPLTRLTRREYNNTIRDLFGNTSRPADGFPEDHDGDFLFRRAGTVSSQ